MLQRELSASDRPGDVPSNIVERRQSSRKRVLLGGLIAARNGAQTWNCSVKDLSELGARIRLAAGQVIPARCMLIDLRDAIVYHATVSWIRSPMCGLKLSEAYKLEGLSDRKLQFARYLWLDRRSR